MMKKLVVSCSGGYMNFAIAIPLESYLAGVKGYSNAPLSLNLLLAPFGLSHHGKADDFLCVGMVCDHLTSLFKDHEAIDPVDVGSACWELGYEPAGQFLDDASLLISELLKQQPF
jgi:hypothetical protein